MGVTVEKLRARRLAALLALALAAGGCGPPKGDIEATGTAVAALIQGEQRASATPTLAFMPVTLRIEADGSGDYASLEEAVRSAPHQATIRLGAGAYHLTRRLNIRRSVRLVGAGMDETEIVSTAAGYAIRFTGDGPFQVEDLTIGHAGDSAGSVVIVRGGAIRFERCRLAGAVSAYEYEERAGLWLMGDTTGLVRDCLFERNDGLGIYVTDNAEPTIENNLATDNSTAGISYYAATGGTAQGNDISGGLMGILVAGESAPTLQGNTCTGAELAGIVFDDESSGTARQNVCNSNEAGMLVTSEAQPMLEANSCTDNELCGIGYKEDAAGTASANECLRNQTGILLDGRARPKLEGNICNENALSGISYREAATGLASGNECVANERYGISVEVTANPTITGNDCHDNGWSDIERLSE
jgi:parallel beta-helix repeat protein